MTKRVLSTDEALESIAAMSTLTEELVMLAVQLSHHAQKLQDRNMWYGRNAQQVVAEWEGRAGQLQELIRQARVLQAQAHAMHRRIRSADTWRTLGAWLMWVPGIGPLWSLGVALWRALESFSPFGQSPATPAPKPVPTPTPRAQPAPRSQTPRSSPPGGRSNQPKRGPAPFPAPSDRLARPAPRTPESPARPRVFPSPISAQELNSRKEAIRAQLNRENEPGWWTKQQCVPWARKRRQSLGGTTFPALGKRGGAKNLIGIYRDSALPLTSETVPDNNFTRVSTLEPGAALVWQPTSPALRGTAGATYGHVAVVEEVYPNAIIVSQSNWPGKPIMVIDMKHVQQNEIFVIPKEARPSNLMR
ncbi:MAG: CHAP domain-containing protein [Ardenticatenia bacterium]|nr:CHAP domain-containing protein [Ardenticatenia bacterium]